MVTISILVLVAGSNPNDSSSRRQEDWIALSASLATTLLAFFLSLIGAGSVLAGLKVLMTRISHASGRTGFHSNANGGTSFHD